MSLALVGVASIPQSRGTFYLASIDSSNCASISHGQPRGVYWVMLLTWPASIALMGFAFYMASVARSHGLHFTWPALIDLLELAMYIASADKSNAKFVL